jgi:hypothetical protein
LGRYYLGKAKIFDTAVQVSNFVRWSIKWYVVLVFALGSNLHIPYGQNVHWS